MKGKKKLTRKERREHLKQFQLANELAKVIHHFFPGLMSKLKELPDHRNQSYITYQKHVLLMTRILSAILYIGSMRKTSEEFNTDTAIENLGYLCREELKEAPYWETINNYLKKLEPEGLQRVIHDLVRRLIRSKAFNGARMRGKYWQVMIDGTQLHSSRKELDGGVYRVHNRGKAEEYTEYCWYVLEAKLVLHPKIVVSIMSEFVENTEKLLNWIVHSLEIFMWPEDLPKPHPHIAFRYEQSVGAPVCYISGLKCLVTLSPRCLRLAHNVTIAYPRLSFGGRSDLSGRDFHPHFVAPFAGCTLNYSLFMGMVYEDKREIQRTVTQEQAEELVAAVQAAVPVREEKPTIAAMRQVISSGQVEVSEELAPILPEINAMLEHHSPDTPACVETLTGLSYTETVTEEKEVSYEDAQELIDHFQKKDYITKSGKIKDTMKNALKNGTLDLPAKYEAARARFERIVADADRKPPIRDASRDVVVRLNKQVMLSPEFTELWDRIKQKTTYRVNIDTEKLVENCVKALREMPFIPKAQLVSQTADLHIEQAGISHTERETRTLEIGNSYRTMPDLIMALRDETLLTPATVYRILKESGRYRDFIRDPEAFSERAKSIIAEQRHALAIDGISYIRLEGEEYYAQEIFGAEEVLANLDRDAVKVEHSVYDYVVYDSATVERPFAVALDNDPDVKMFFKIPSRFKIDTPIGTYNPDWAVYLTKNGEEKLYFVLETKGNTGPLDLRPRERLKIHCGKRHFEALANGIAMQEETADWMKAKGELLVIPKTEKP